jgi:hypothetical protein
MINPKRGVDKILWRVQVQVSLQVGRTEQGTEGEDKSVCTWVAGNVHDRVLDGESAGKQ